MLTGGSSDTANEVATLGHGPAGRRSMVGDCALQHPVLETAPPALPGASWVCFGPGLEKGRKNKRVGKAFSLNFVFFLYPASSNYA